MEPDLSGLDAEIANVKEELRAIISQTKVVEANLASCRDEIFKAIKEDPNYLRSDASQDAVKNEIQLTNDYVSKIKKFDELEKHLLELTKKRKALKNHSGHTGQ